MWISERAAAGILFLGTGMDRTTARQLLGTGLAGVGRRDPDGRVRYDQETVEALAQRPLISPADLEEVAPLGAVIARFSAGRPWSHHAPAVERMTALAGPWEIGASARIALHAYVGAKGAYPLFATACGFVVAGADIVGRPGWNDGPVELTLAEPGAWFDAIADGRWQPGRGGSPLQVWHPRPPTR